MCVCSIDTLVMMPTLFLFHFFLSNEKNNFMCIGVICSFSIKDGNVQSVMLILIMTQSEEQRRDYLTFMIACFSFLFCMNNYLPYEKSFIRKIYLT